MLPGLKATMLGTVAALALIGCAATVPPPPYSQNRAIDQDIAAAHVFGPATTSPAAPAWQNEQLGEAP